MTRHSIYAVTFLLSAFALGCSNSPKMSDYDSSFRTRISKSGLKHFELRLRPDPEKSKRGNRSRQSNARQSPRSASRNYDKIQESMEGLSKELIEENQFCRTGFWVLDFDIDTRGPFLRGECYELANSTDRAAHPDTIKNW